jgi:hypothetical protein
MTFDQACQQLPPDAVWTHSYGRPGTVAFCAYYTTPSGECWEIVNGLSQQEPDWSCRRMR